MVEIFGFERYNIKGDVLKRVSGKGCGVMSTFLFSTVVHIKGVIGYSKFRICSNIDRNVLCNVGTENRSGWYSGPAHSPGGKGAVKSMIKNSKRCIPYVIANLRLSASEFSTMCACCLKAKVAAAPPGNVAVQAL